MTKKHFIALADALIASRPERNTRKDEQWFVDMQAIANCCGRANSRFNHDRWIGYILGQNGPNGGKL